MDLKEVVDFTNNIIWSPALIYLCLGTGLFFSVITKFAQIRHFGEMVRLLLDNESSKKGISSFQALAVSLSGRVGTGNIAGVAAAIGFGGPGAVFWMWVVAFLGASTAYVEATLGQIFKEEHDGQYRGGPAYYFEKCLGQTWFGLLFAVATVISCGLFLPGVQANSVGNAIEAVVGTGDMINTSFGTIGVNKILSLSVILIILGFIIFGGIKRIANVAQYIVPFMAIGYIMIAVIICLLNITILPDIVMLILKDAFSPQAGLGAAIGWGVKRGVYSNEAGQGTGPHAAAAAEVEHPAQQGLVQAFSVYIDTLFVCSATAFMILITNMYNIQVSQGGTEIYHGLLPFTTEVSSSLYTQAAVQTFFGGFGKPFVAVALFFFAFTTILAYYYIAEVNVSYITRFIKAKSLIIVLKFALMFSVFYGTINSAGYIWSIGDIGVGMMAWLNIIGILIIFFICKPAITCLRDYEQQLKDGVDKYTFDPVKLGIKNATFWEERIEKARSKALKQQLKQELTLKEKTLKSQEKVLRDNERTIRKELKTIEKDIS